MNLRHNILCLTFLIASSVCLAQHEARFKIGFAHVGNNNPYYQEMEQTALKEANKLGAEVELKIAKEDQAAQNAQILELLDKGVQGIIVNPVNEYGVMPAIKKAKERGVPVIAIDRPLYGDFLAYVGIDQWRAGQLQGQYIVTLLPQGGNIVVLMGIPGEPASIGREKGMLNILEHPSNKGRYNILATYRADYNMEKGFEKMNEAIQAFGSKIQLVYALNDAMALGALKALRQAKLTKVMVLGIDAQNEALNEIIKEGQYKSTVTNNPKEITQKAITLLVEHLKGKNITPLRKVITGTVLVTKDNAKKLKKAGEGF